jgi:hypothetical protein
MPLYSNVSPRAPGTVLLSSQFQMQLGGFWATLKKERDRGVPGIDPTINQQVLQIIFRKTLRIPFFLLAKYRKSMPGDYEIVVAVG